MAVQLVPLSISAPGFYGLNFQEASVDLPVNWALEAYNCVIDQYGRVAARQGWVKQTATPLGAGTPIETIFEYVKVDGTTEILSCVDNKIYKGTTTLTDITPAGPTITANNWKVVNFNNKAYFFQSGHVPLEYNGTDMGYVTRSHTAKVNVTAYTVGQTMRLATTTAYYYVCTTGGTTAAAEGVLFASPTVGATITDGTAVWTTYEVPKGDSVLGALGRLWVSGVSTDKSVVYYSDTLIGHDFVSGAAGNIDLKSVWTNGQDTVTTIEAFNGNLVILAYKSILLYAGASAPSTMSLGEHIKGVGCISKHSVQDIGNDLIFLSDKGLMSLGRLIQQAGSIPMDDVSANVRDMFVAYINNETLVKIRSTYNENEGFYLLALPTTGTTFCFDVRSKLEDGTFKTTIWNHIAPYGLCTTRARLTYLGKAGMIGLYDGYLDNTSSYRMAYRSTWQHLENQTQIKMLKSLEVTTIGGTTNASLIAKIKYDYKAVDNAFTKLMSSTDPAEYGTSEYGIAEYYTTSFISTYKYQLMGSGRTFQFAIESDINGAALSIQKIDILTKLGRIV